MKNSIKKIGAQHKVAAAAAAGDDGGAGASANSQPALPPPQAPAVDLQMIMPQEDSPMVMDSAPIGASSFAQFCPDLSDFEEFVLDAPLDAPPPPLAIRPAAAAPAAPSPPTPTTHLTLQRITLHECNFEESVMSELSTSDDLYSYILGGGGAAFAVKEHCAAVLELIAVDITGLSVTETASAFAAFFRELFAGRREARIVVAPLFLGGKDLRVHGFVAILGAKRTVGEEGESGIAALVSSAELSKLRQAVDKISGGGGIVYFNNQIAYAPPPTL